MLYKAGEIAIKAYEKLMLKMDIYWQTDPRFDPVLYVANLEVINDPVGLNGRGDRAQVLDRLA